MAKLWKKDSDEATADSGSPEAATTKESPVSATAIPDHQRTDANVPAADDPIKPDGPTDLTAKSWRGVLRRTFHEFNEDQCTDLAAGLTYYSVLSIFPGLLAIFSLLGVVGQGEESVQKILDILGPLVSQKTLDSLEPTLVDLASSQAAGLTLLIGLVGAVWSASGYVRGFGRAMNNIYEVREGRPAWKLIPSQLLLTLVVLVLCALALVMLIVSGPVAESIGDVVGLGSTAVTIWTYAKWPVLAVVVVLIVALLYQRTPNVKQPGFRWLSLGAFLAIMVWVAASVGFAFYVANFGSYNKTYGSLAGVIITLLWLWLTNTALLFGAELDSELERGRQLQAGMAAEEDLQLPVRDNRGILKREEKKATIVNKARAVRDAMATTGDPADRPYRR